MATSQRKQELRDRRKTAGLCIDCGASTLYLRCICCKMKNAASRKRYYERRKESGKCITAGCQAMASEGRQRCDKCTDTNANYEKNRAPRDQATYMKEYRKKRIAEGRCPTCGILNTTKNTLQCDTCAVKHRARCENIKRDVFYHYGGPVCAGCSEIELAVLQLDHINGGGNKHAKEIGGRGKMYKWVHDNNYPPGFRVLCANCNIRAYRKLKFPNEVNNA